ncbi:MAG: beta-ketoacyl-ACP reductase [Planctomycetaceae bacterium]|jgi:3-oxoacyl-[acyl-carrier protein] reductase|nr:beta-ketoacyl-ACP reductase [Planctomycetaceae bacterium]MDP7277375.1 SDR family NAD(P)-dependent oxidoreductase [Planctomycetaceae bacterium]
MSESEFSGRHVLITGGTRGIGKALADSLAVDRARLSLNYVSRAEDAATAVADVEAAGGEAVAVAGDVSTPEGAAAIVSGAREAFGPIDMLVNSAGVSRPLPADEITWEHWKNTLSINLDGTFSMVYAVKDEMIERQYGRIVTVSSIAGLRERENQLPYSTSKAGVIALTRCAAQAWGRHNVRINCLCPGLTETEMAFTLSPEAHAEIIGATPLGRIGQPAEVAAVARFLLSDQSSYMTGQTVVSSGGRVMLPG